MEITGNTEVIYLTITGQIAILVDDEPALQSHICVTDIHFIHLQH